MTLHNWRRCAFWGFYFRGRKCIHYKSVRWIDLRYNYKPVPGTNWRAAPLPDSVQVIMDRQPGLHADRHHGGIF